MNAPHFAPSTPSAVGRDGLRTFLNWVAEDQSSQHAVAAQLLRAALHMRTLPDETEARLVALPEPHLLEAVDALSVRMKEYKLDLLNIVDYLRLWVGPLDSGELQPVVGQRGVRLLRLDDDPPPEAGVPPQGGLIGFAWVRDFHPDPLVRRDANAVMLPGFMGRLSSAQTHWVTQHSADRIVESLLMLRRSYSNRVPKMIRKTAEEPALA